MHEWAAARQGSSQRQSSGTAQKIAPADAKMPGKLILRVNGSFEWSGQLKFSF
jgi:membrane protease subunit (stomatin/prohibitin family)